ncbi:hypothetical protein BAU28_18920 [Bacillus paramycoides]|uniref:Uncharacterized protein n=1 Tax=Bacillus paramycoides TaxID=2026194 RepID=A0A1J9V9H0_9BACI|nr:hypothetical protein BAU28_18920 [Bacillus paramycoides]
MFWLGGITGYFVGILVTLLVIHFWYWIGGMSKGDEEWLEESADKEMEQLRVIRGERIDRFIS